MTTIINIDSHEEAVGIIEQMVNVVHRDLDTVMLAEGKHPFHGNLVVRTDCFGNSVGIQTRAA